MILHQSPYVFLCQENDIKVVASPWWSGVGTFNAAVDGKTTEWFKTVIPQTTSTCTLMHLQQMLQIAETDLGLVPFSGSGLPKDSAGLSDKFCFVTSSEKFSQFVFDPWVKEGRSINLNLVTETFKGDMWGRVTCRMEDKPLRCNNAASFAAPEVRVDSVDAYNRYNTVPNPTYSNITLDDGTEGSPIEIGFFVGQSGYDAVPVGPPPAQFASDNPPDNFAKMTWNGELRLTKKFLIPQIGDDGSITGWEMNNYGENLKFISQATYGIVGRERKSIIPVIYLRKRGK